MANTIEVDAQEVMNEFVLTIEITNWRKFVWRQKIALGLIWLAGRIMGTYPHIEDGWWFRGAKVAYCPFCGRSLPPAVGGE